MSDAAADTFRADYEALNNLVVNCSEFMDLEAKLGDFNLFQVLRSEYSELKHSNILAWLLDPAESHGLDDLFLQRWLMRVLHTSSSQNRTRITPVDIDAWELRSVEIRREWNHIDILIILQMVEGDPWIICIENKVHSFQHSDQLAKYRGIVGSEFRSASHRLFLFLTKSGEEPEDEDYIPTTYAEVHQALMDAVSQRRLSIGKEPRVLIDNYIRLLEEKFMNESDIARMALTIYQKHRRALDVIFAHRPESIKGMVLPRLAELLDEKAESLGIIGGPHGKSYVRFIPKEWNQPGNHSARGWPRSNIGVAFEIDFFIAYPRFLIVAARPPEEWVNKMQQVCDREPFKQLEGQRCSGIWPRLYSEAIDIIPDHAAFADHEEAAKTILEWIKSRLSEADMKTIIRTIANELPELGRLQSQSAGV